MVIGITGGIGSGKTLVTDYLSRFLPIVDADVISRGIFTDGEGAAAIARAFPDCVKNGLPDRAALREKIFASPAAVEKLNSVTHPLIIERIKAELRGKERVVLSAPLLYEAGLDGLCDTVVAIVAPVAARVARVMARDAVSEESVRRTMSAQIAEEELIRRADVVIINDSSKDELLEKVKLWYDGIK